MKRRAFISKTAAWVLAGGIYVPRLRAQRLQQSLQPPFLKPAASAAGGGSYTANAVDLAGSGCWMERDADLNGSLDTKLCSWSLWYKPDVITGTQSIYNNTGDRGDLGKQTTTDLFRARFYTAAAVSSVQFDQNSTNFGALTAGNWYNILGAFDTSNTNNAHLYINNTECLTKTTFIVDAIIEFTVADHAIGAAVGGGFDVNGCLAEIWIAPGQYIDFSVLSNRQKFINGGVPVDLGATGNTPTGTAPLIYFKNAAASFTTNSGTGGDFVKKGATAFADCSNHP